MAEKKVPYQVNGRQFEGMIVHDDSVNAKRPAIFMQPDWKGVCGDTIAQARTVAGKDYVVLMADMFGLGYGDKPKTPQELMAGSNIKGKVLALHGSADPVTPKPMMDAFEEELTKANVEWQVMMFGGAVHSFCDPTADAGPTRYDEKLCRKSYMLMRDFFAETL